MNKKASIILFMVLLLVTNVNATAPTEEWNFSYGTSQWDRANAVYQTSDDGYALAGATYETGDGQLWFVKTDSNGNQAWNRSYGGANDETGYSVYQTSDGGYIMAGYTDSYDSSPGDNYGKPWLLKTDSSGVPQWNGTYGDYGGTHSEFVSAQQTSDGGYVAAGRVRDNGNIRAYIVKTDSSGNLEWEWNGSSIPGYGSRTSLFYSVQQTLDNGYIVGGEVYRGGDNRRLVFLGRFNSTGSYEWGSTFTGDSHSFGVSARETSDGGYVVLSRADLGIGYWFWLIKTNSTGDQQWEGRYRVTQFDYPTTVRETSDDGFILAGFTGVYDYWLLKLDSGGAPQWNVTFDHSRNVGMALYDGQAQQTSDGGYVLAGYIDNAGTGNDMVLVKYAGAADTTPPNLTWNWTDINSTIVNNFTTICVNASEAVNCTLWINGTNYTNLTSATNICWSPELANGNYTLNATCDDTSANNANTSNAWLSVDTSISFILTKSANTTVTFPGNWINWTITVNNTGPGAINITLNDSNGQNFSVTGLAAGDNYTISYTTNASCNSINNTVNATVVNSYTSSTDNSSFFVNVTSCGDGVCNCGETKTSCPVDCKGGGSSCNKPWKCTPWTKCIDGKKTRECECDCAHDKDCNGNSDEEKSCGPKNKTSDGEASPELSTGSETQVPSIEPPQDEGPPDLSVEGEPKKDNKVDVVVKDSKGSPAEGDVEVTSPNGSKSKHSLSQGRVPIILESSGDWTFTYTDSEGTIVTKTITVGGVSQNSEEIESEVIKQETVVPKPIKNQPTDMTWLWAVVVLVLLGLFLFLIWKKKKKKDPAITK